LQISAKSALRMRKKYGNMRWQEMRQYHVTWGKYMVADSLKRRGKEDEKGFGWFRKGAIRKIHKIRKILRIKFHSKV